MTFYESRKDIFDKITYNVVLDSEKLKISYDILLCMIFYYEYLTYPKMQTGDLLKLLKNYDYLQTILSSLRTLAISYDRFLPWVNEKEFSKYTDNKSKKWMKDTFVTSAVAFLAFSKNKEIAIVKLLERLHILKNIESLKVNMEIYPQLIQNSREIYAKVAETLGVWNIKSEIEDLSLKIENKEKYYELVKALDETKEHRDEYIKNVILIINEVLSHLDIQLTIEGRAKHLYGIYRKMEALGLDISDINDLLGVRVIVESNEVADCYRCLYEIIKNFDIVQSFYGKGKLFRDWIDDPKPNGYQSIHLTISYDNRLFEIQIRTRNMHMIAEEGSAAHWVYREAGNNLNNQLAYKEYIDQISKFRRRFDIEINNNPLEY